ncbi:MAG: hypothetical protein HY519_00785 [Candidatus Aenigmarchaeota archaeon]|nr:hypothetical protein [Candidatus Aenigmarchaeota archaeon]
MKQFFSVFLVILLSLVLAADSYALQVAAASETIFSNIDEVAVFDVTVRNDNDYLDSFTLLVEGDSLEWMVPVDILLAIPPHAEKTTKVAFMPRKIGAYNYRLTVSSYSYPAIASSLDLTVTARKPETKIDKLELGKLDDGIKIKLQLSTQRPTTADVRLAIKGEAGAVVKTMRIAKEMQQSATLELPLSLVDLEAGKYFVEAVVDSSTASAEFQVAAVHNIQQERERVSSLLHDEITITVSNLGNVPETYSLSEPMEGGKLTAFVTKQPASCYVNGEYRECAFMVENLAPKTSSQIIYRIEYWPSVAQFILAVFMLAVLAFGTVQETARPRISKAAITKPDGTRTVMLEVKNPVWKLNNVIVRDFVSPLAVVEGFEHTKPVLRKSEAGTELIWKIGNLDSREHRILSYKVRPLVEGNIKMPRAYLRFRSSKNKRVKIYSGRINL